ncbi:RNA polymerase sporulation sigma factor SigG [Clostridia bacterium]|nr:RNA polymerase sporulation sigma factor SigG [Clostridia bacterium]
MYYNKVEISGVNTANLKVLKEADKIRLLKLARAGDCGARDELICGNLRLVLSVVGRMSGRKSGMRGGRAKLGETPDDLFQVGCIGLIKAIDNFDLSQGVKFSTYAVPMILGEVKRFLRDNNQIRVSRSVRDLAYRAMQVKEQLTCELSREPTVQEISDRTGARREEVVLALEAISEPMSLYEPVFSESGDTIYVMDQIGEGGDDKGWIDEISMKEALRSLLPREKRILDLRFFAGKTQVEVAKEIGISQAQVSRLEKAALNKIRDN